MTIKQQGGIFGRNPEFNELDTTGDTNLGDGAVFVDSINKRLGIDKTNPAYPLDFNIDASGQIARFGDANASTYVSFAQPRAYVGFMNGGAALMGGVNKDVIIYAGASSVDDADARVAVFEHTTGNLNLNIGAGRGNVILGSGQGIDFSATSGTGTSELFDDYEEGTFTPAFIASGVTITHDIQVGRYVKVGDMVTVWINIGTDAVSGTAANLSITGLPYSSESGYSASGYVGLNYSFASPVGVVSIASSTTELRFYANNSSTRQTSAILGTGTNSNRLHIVCSYRVA
jgi:hypothetical protein